MTIIHGYMSPSRMAAAHIINSINICIFVVVIAAGSVYTLPSAAAETEDGSSTATAISSILIRPAIVSTMFPATAAGILNNTI